MAATDKIRPTKKQRALLVYIDGFITEHGYSPSYREIMKGLDYKSIATVALHINSLITRGHLVKRDHSARSLEVVETTKVTKLSTNQIKEADEKWLVEKVDYYFSEVEKSSRPSSSAVDNLYVLVGALKVLGLDGAAHSFIPRLSKIKERT